MSFHPVRCDIPGESWNRFGNQIIPCQIRDQPRARRAGARMRDNLSNFSAVFSRFVRTNRPDISASVIDRKTNDIDQIRILSSTVRYPRAGKLPEIDSMKAIIVSIDVAPRPI